MSDDVILAGIDPGLAHSGFVRVGVQGVNGTATPKLTVRFTSCLKTEKSKRKERRTDEDLRVRLRQITKFYHEVLDREKPLLAIFESPAWFRNAGVSAKIGMAWGTVHAVCVMHRIPVFTLSAQEIKKGCGLLRSASKEEVETVVRAKMPYELWPTGCEREHIFDAAGAVLAFMNQNPDWPDMIRSGLYV